MTTPLVIQTHEQHQAVLAEISQLMDRDPAPDTPEGERLGQLVDLAHEYEAHMWPRVPPHQAH